ncbi:MAG: signal transduction histidine kinase [Rhodospirillales bacterium]|nr:signal transduction histidine kinase [Rhodospirillales bacterium]
MTIRLLLAALEQETDIVLVRKRTRRLAELLGFDAQDQTRITTAVSEIARNAFEYAGGGRVDFRFNIEATPQCFEIVISDTGPGIKDLDAVLAGTRRSATGMGVGLIGARRLMDHFTIEAAPGAGTCVALGKTLSPRMPRVNQTALKRISQALAADEPANPVEEIRRQNHEMLVQLEEIQNRQEDLQRLNQELQDTNRGVVALYAELDERAEHLRRADELKSKFLSNMSHEFRTPLNSILALARLLLGRTDGELSAEQEKQVHFIRKSAESLTELVNDLLDLAKVEAGKIVVTPVEFTAETLFGTLRGMLRPLLVGDSTVLLFEDPTDIPMIVGDEGKISQILRNFISNALKFTPQGEVRVWASYDRESDTVTFSCRDTGIGIAEGDLGIIFQEFGQVAHPLQARVKGTGLGLPLARKLAELLGGSVAVVSAIGQGSVFSVTLPRVYRDAAVDEEEEQYKPEPGRIPLLMVEDDAADAFVLERSLAASRYQLVRARSVAQAKRILEHLRPAAILLDIVLRGDESWRFVVQLRQQDETSAIPIIVSSSTGDEQKALHLGADTFLAKPIDPREVIETLERLTGYRSVTRLLLVDDQEVSRYLVRQLLPRGIYDLKEAATGVEGWTRLNEERPDVLLLDLNMPGMSGFEFIARLSADGSLHSVPTVILTSAILDEGQRDRLGKATRIISKSDLSSPMLIAAIKEALERATEAAA